MFLVICFDGDGGDGDSDGDGGGGGVGGDDDDDDDDEEESALIGWSASELRVNWWRARRCAPGVGLCSRRAPLGET